MYFMHLHLCNILPTHAIMLHNKLIFLSNTSVEEQGSKLTGAE